MSCHRAHATSAPNAGRWDFNVLGMAADGVNSGSYKIPNPYDGGQRSLCNKCHSKDEFDAAGGLHSGSVEFRRSSLKPGAQAPGFFFWPGARPSPRAPLWCKWCKWCRDSGAGPWSE